MHFLPPALRKAVAQDIFEPHGSGMQSQVSKCLCPQKEREEKVNNTTARNVEALIPQSSFLPESDSQPQRPRKQYFKEEYSATDTGFES